MTAAVRRNPSWQVSPPIAGAVHEICYALNGHSGARVILHARNGAGFVRKSASSPAHNARLLAQMRKQHDLRRSGIAMPRVIASGVDSEGCAYFDMAFVPGRTVADAVIHSTAFATDSMLSAIEKILWLFRTCKAEPIPAAQFHRKIESIIRDASARWGAGELTDAIYACGNHLRDQDWTGIANSPSHGDLTLENIMLTTEGEIVFIDCDAPWVSSYWLDAGKLFQDVYGHWCLRGIQGVAEHSLQRANAIEKLAQLAARLRVLVRDHDADLADRLPALAAINLFRALPYTSGARTASFICRRILRVLKG